MPQYAVRFTYPTSPTLDDAVEGVLRDIAEVDLKTGETDAGGRHGDVWLITADDADHVTRLVAEVRARVPEILDVALVENRGMV
ncbi:hypothetical protein [Cellulomonas sp. C5510]|uniref:hypothetical protein n=1 Tax=Cellulomonas sp. C5510 TaxID=2871170 RepID=UPI001C978000|nr:hypothetical protein [Cellulomonas sp. C5510]QZN85311.1 hypothetical protein K5O09_16315 [Cellulomonas sp. C5510]